MKVVFLGTNGWYNTSTANTMSVFVQAAGYNVIFDAGDGFYKIDQFIKDTNPVYIFISHLHLDHITGLHTLNKFNFKQPVKIYTQKGNKELIENIIRPPYSIDMHKLPYRIEFVEIEEGRFDFGFFVEARKLLHPVECLGYSIEIDNKKIVYLCDTGPCDNAITLARNADLVIAECALKSGQDNQAWPHLNPVAAAGIAKRAGAKKLALTHFNPHLFAGMEDRVIAEGEARQIFPDTFYTKDNLEISL